MLLKATGLPIALISLYLCLMCAIFLSILEPKMQPTDLLRRKQQLITRIALPHSPIHNDFSRSIVYLFILFSTRTHSDSRSTSFCADGLMLAMMCGFSRMKEKMALIQFLGMFLVQSWQLCSLSAYSFYCLYSCPYCSSSFTSFTYFIYCSQMCYSLTICACCSSSLCCGPQKWSSDSARKSSLTEKVSMFLSSWVQMEILEQSGAILLRMCSRVLCQREKWSGSRNCELSADGQQNSFQFSTEWAMSYMFPETWRAAC